MNIELIISGIMGLITLIVFFIMAVNISKMAKDVKLIKQSAFLFMNGTKLTTNRCNHCNTEYYSEKNEREYCPHCGYLNIKKSSKNQKKEELKYCEKCGNSYFENNCPKCSK